MNATQCKLQYELPNVQCFHSKPFFLKSKSLLNIDTQILFPTAHSRQRFLCIFIFNPMSAGSNAFSLTTPRCRNPLVIYCVCRNPFEPRIALSLYRCSYDNARMQIIAGKHSWWWCTDHDAPVFLNGNRRLIEDSGYSVIRARDQMNALFIRISRFNNWKQMPDQIATHFNWASRSLKIGKPIRRKWTGCRSFLNCIFTKIYIRFALRISTLKSPL